MTERAVIYTRVSTEEQGRGYSLSTQLDSCRGHADKCGYEVVAEFTDMYSGQELDRPGLIDLYSFLGNNPVDVVVVHDIDRLSREVGHQAIIEIELSRYDLRVDYVLGQYADTPEGQLLKLVKSGIAQYENQQRVERSRRGKRGRAKAGYVIMSAERAPFGYDYVSEKHKGWLVINEEQAVVVRQMYHWLIDDGLSSYAIAKALFDNDILSKGDISPIVVKKEGPGSWSPSTVRRILSNPVYKGIWYYGKTRRYKVGGRSVQRALPKSEWIPVEVPAIVDEETWRTAQECLALNKKQSKRNTKRKYLLRSMVFCPCGRRWVGLHRKRFKRSYYRCPSNLAEHWRRRCENRFSIRAEILEEVVWDRVASFILHPENLRQEVERQRSQAEEANSRLASQLEAIEQAVADIDRKLSVLLDEVLTGSFSRSVIDAKQKQLAEQRANLLAEEQRIRGELEMAFITPDKEEELMRFASELKDALKDVTFKEKRRILELIKLRVEVISRTQIKLSGVISLEGSFVDISC